VLDQQHVIGLGWARQQANASPTTWFSRLITDLLDGAVTAPMLMRTNLKLIEINI
jgi:hypothetical protein